MHFQYTPYIWPLIVSAAVTAALAVYAMRHKIVPGAIPFGICMLLTTLWSGSYALEIAGIDLPTKLFWANVQSIAYSLNPVLWLVMVFMFIEREHWVSRRNILILLIIPVITVALAWTNELHGLMRQNVSLDMEGSFPVIVKTYGLWFWIIVAYSYGLNIISEYLLGLSLRRKSALYREQSLSLFIGLALLIIQNALYIFGLHPVSDYDLTPVVTGISGLIIAGGVFRYRLFDIVPVARENIIENMDDGVIVLDAQNRIADMNQTAINIFGTSSVQAIGQKAEDFFKYWPVLAKISGTLETQPGELYIYNEEDSKTFELSYLSLRDRRGKHSGLSIIFHDVTERRLIQTKLMEQQRNLAMSEERERLARDLHDNLGQVFGFINVQAQAIKHELAGDKIASASQKLERLVEAAQSSHGEMRTYIQNVKSTAAVKDLLPDIKKQLEQMRLDTGINATLRISDAALIEGMEANKKGQILNIAKEALNNIRKHAQAKQAVIEFKAAAGEITIMIEDDGQGFVLMQQEKESAHGWGLEIMKERAREIGGDIKIESVPGQGTRILLRVPAKKGVIEYESHAGG
ncbi:MAG: histidine kinase N-terminal 7TM domain-containing protein [Syntrophomonas sp.]